MTQLELYAIISSTLLSLISIYLYIRLLKTHKEMETKEKVENQRLYQIVILKEIQDKIGYSLDLEKIIEVVTAGLEHLFPYSTASSILIQKDKLVFRSHVKENVNSSFIMQVKRSMVASINALVPNPPEKVEESIHGATVDETKRLPVSSFFNIPLVVGNKIVGLINISSTQKGLYKEAEMTILYQIVGQASNAISRLKYVLDTEEAKLTSMISSLADGVFMVDKSKNLLIINEAARRYLEVASKNPNFFDILSSIGNQYDLVSKIEKVISTNQPIEEKEIEINNKVFQTFVTPVPNLAEDAEQNKNLGASILLHDITLEKNVARIKEDFTHMIVHELRAPLTAIKDSSELMIEVFEEKGNMEKEQQKRLLKIIDVQSKNLLEQINQVLDAAKIEAGRFSINKVETDISEVIQNAIEPFLPQANKKQLTISTDVFYPLPKVDIDPIRITQVLDNLISNSIKFTQAGGKIVVSAKPGDGILTVSVSDNGMGIPESEQKDLFQKYFQIRTTPHELSKKGTGLGLYIIKGIVEAHGGSVGVISGAGKGTTIYFNLPFAGSGPRVLQGHQGEKTVSAGLVN